MGQVAGSASPASRLPQVSGAAQARDGAGCRVSIAGSRLPQVLGAVQARDGAGCRVSIAGKPAPTGNGCSAGLMGDGLPGMGRVAESASPASRLPQVSGAAQARDGAGCRVSIAGCRLPQVLGAVQALWELACQRWGRLQDYHRRKPPLRVKTPSASRCCFCVQPLWAHRRNNPGAGLSAGDCGKCPGAFRKWCTCATCDPGTGSRYCSCAAG